MFQGRGTVAVTPLRVSLLVVVACLAVPPRAVGGIMMTFANQLSHRNLGDNYPEVGQFRLPNDQTFSGTMIRKDWVVTTAHTVDTATKLKFRISGNTHEVDSWYTPDTWRRDPIQGNDIALVHLKRPPAEFQTAPIRQNKRSKTEDIHTAGYGEIGTGRTGPLSKNGLRYGGANRIDGDLFGNPKMASIDLDVNPNSGRYTGPDFKVDNFETQLPMTFEYIPAKQDAGGGAFADDGTLEAVPSTIFGLFDGETDYSYTDTVGMTRLPAWSDWIDQVMDEVEEGDLPANTYTGSRGDPIFPESLALNLTAGQIQEARPVIGDLTPPNLRSGFFLGPLAIPEPATASLLAPAAGLLMLRPRRRRQ